MAVAVEDSAGCASLEEIGSLVQSRRRRMARVPRGHIRNTSNAGLETRMMIRTAVHLHSKWSYDGSWELGELARALKDRNYRAALMSEHDRGFSPARWDDYRADCLRNSSPDLTLVPGIEYSDPDNCVHVLVWGSNLPFLGEALATRTLLERVAQHGGTAVLAHPWRRDAWKIFSDDWAPLLTGVELWNRKSDGFAPSAHGIDILDRHRLWPVASLDFHRARQFFPLAMQLEAKDASVDALLEAVRERRGSAEAFGRPAAKFRGGFWALGAAVAEGLRRPAAGFVRRISAR
jgi:hypothetical protein